jgi:phosphatidylglycerophosphatase A
MIKQKIIHFFAAGFNAGLLPWAPGTLGTLVAIPFYLLLQNISLTFYAILLILAFIIGVWLCDKAAKISGITDDPAIVWDEMVGFWLTMFAVPFSFWNVLLGFLLFRLFDIWKPWPIRFIDANLSGGLGIMLDDVLAGIYANICLQVIQLA